LKRFLTSTDPGFADALLLYVRNTAPAIRTDTNEITFWLDNCPKSFAGQFYVFGFYLGRQLVGYAEAAYFPGEFLFALDYVVIDEAFRRNNIFFEFVDHLRRFLERTHPEYRYAVAEVTYGPGEEHPSSSSQLLSRLLKIQGFRVVRAPYYQPRLTRNDAESEMAADLLLLSQDSLERLQKETYLSIVRTLYYSYYLPWSDIVPGASKEYRRHLDRLFSRINLELGKKRIVLLNGHSVTLHAPSTELGVNPHRRTIAFSAQALGVIVAVTASMVVLRATFSLSNNSFVTVYALALFSFMAVAAVVSKEARAVFLDLIGLTKFLSGKRASNSMPTVIGTEETEKEDPGEPKQLR
jgi:hypothetical protein